MNIYEGWGTVRYIFKCPLCDSAPHLGLGTTGYNLKSHGSVNLNLLNILDLSSSTSLVQGRILFVEDISLDEI